MPVIEPTGCDKPNRLPGPVDNLCVCVERASSVGVAGEGGNPGHPPRTGPTMGPPTGPPIGPPTGAATGPPVEISVGIEVCVTGAAGIAGKELEPPKTGVRISLPK
mmetsp:Transcript_60494/g.110280  ORF Transcript_60494/g.110280 Transcript_60494/m.110280 type:complete len:106 (-) Transcript_60494:52-369(-)